jgi:hypothetical protein
MDDAPGLLMKPKPPYRVTSSVRRFLSTLESAREPVFLPFVHTSTDYKTSYCLSNCEAEHRRTGAQIIFGWMVWESRPNSFLETEFHSLVRRNGRFEDITPRQDGEKFIVFAPDSVRTATRIDERTWETWSNHKQYGQSLEATHRVFLQDVASSVWA